MKQTKTTEWRIAYFVASPTVHATYCLLTHSLTDLACMVEASLLESVYILLNFIFNKLYTLSTVFLLFAL